MTRGLIAVAIIAGALRLAAGEPSSLPVATPEEATATRGYRLLTEKAYLPFDFDQQTFDELWKCWPEPLRSQAEKATADERRQLAYSRYGLTPRPNDPTKPLQYVVDANGRWTMNCFACHGGKVAGQAIAGLPNSHYALMTLTDEVRTTKIRLEKAPARMELGSVFMPLGTSNGTTNAVNFGVALMGFRDKDLNFHERLPPRMLHHDMDAPPWWHFAKKQRLYIDGFATKGHRGLMQFMLVRSNGPGKFREWEDEFRDVFAYLSSIKPPKYPFPVDHALAKQGAAVFNRHCAECHGAYDEQPDYPERMVPITEIGTDRARYDSLTPAHRRAYGDSWFTNYGKLANIDAPEGYVAPPLDGIWASAPYLHNGSVPTLWRLLNPSQRPVVWTRSEDGYDQNEVGLEVITGDDLPGDVREEADKRTWFDTRQFGKSRQGHAYPERLTRQEKTQVLEYLKTL